MTTVVDPLETGRAVTELTAAGKSIAQIAEQLGVTPRTVTRWRARHLAIEESLSTDWHRQAACRDEAVDPRWFIPADDTHATYTRGKAVCARCPVRDACLTDALTREGRAEADDRAGLWGGLTPNQRAALTRVRRNRRRPA